MKNLHKNGIKPRPKKVVFQLFFANYFSVENRHRFSKVLFTTILDCLLLLDSAIRRVVVNIICSNFSPIGISGSGYVFRKSQVRTKETLGCRPSSNYLS